MKSFLYAIPIIIFIVGVAVLAVKDFKYRKVYIVAILAAIILLILMYGGMIL